MKKIFTILLILSLIPIPATFLKAVDDISSGSSAGKFEKVGAAGAQFLKIPIGARGTGMAGAFGSVVNDLTCLYWNPAGIAKINDMSAHFSYSKWFAGFDHSFAAFALPLGDNFTTAVQFISFGSSNIPVTTIDNPNGTGTYYSAQDMAIGATFGGKLTDQFTFGLTLKYVSNEFTDLTATGIAFDIGTMYETGIMGIRLGFSIHNLGLQMRYSGQDLNTTRKIWESLNAAPLDAQYLTSSYNMPLLFRASISSEIISDETNLLIGAFDFTTHSDTKEQFAIGAEYTWNKLLSVRAGYRIGHDQFNIAAGVGINYVGGGFAGQIDYSLNPTFDLGLVHRISVNLSIK
jgi:hypothetical protein